ncbi:hypothetical protein [Psychrobacter vallis]|nr:hypothetical protein [Psychrobacter vallis]
MLKLQYSGKSQAKANRIIFYIVFNPNPENQSSKKMQVLHMVG